MGQIGIPATIPALLLTDIDRLIAENADGGVSPTAQNMVLLGQSAGRNDAASRVYIIGLNAGGGASVGGMTTGLAGTVAIGANALAVVGSEGTGGSSQVGSNIAIGENAAAALLFGSANIVIGQNALAALAATTAVPARRNVVIGDGAMGNQTNNANPRDELVVMGYNAGRAAAAAVGAPLRTSVIIGSLAYSAYQGVGNSHVTNVIIGYRAAFDYNCDPSGGAQNVYIGGECGAGNTGTGNTVIGYGASGKNSAGTASCVAVGRVSQALSSNSTAIGESAQCQANSGETVAIGSAATCVNPSPNATVIGASATCTGAGSIRLGYGAGQGEGATTHRHIIETVITGTRRATFYADGSTGNVILGNSIPGTNRDTAGAGATNIVKLLDGTIGAAAPVGGGYFYVNAGALHWVGSAGTDTPIAPA